MGKAASTAQRVLSTEQDHRILLIGLDGAGKTTILYRIKLGEVVFTIPTIGFQVETVQYKNFSFTVFDTSGKDKIRPLWRHYYVATSGLVWVIDSNDTDRLAECKKELHGLIFNEPELQNTLPLLIYANKMDLFDCMCVDGIISDLFDSVASEYAVTIMQKQYPFDNYKQVISEIIVKQYEKDNDIEINQEICELIVEFVPCVGMIGKLGERDFCILPISASTGSENIYEGLNWMECILNPSKKDCLIM
eukprot:153853_1